MTMNWAKIRQVAAREWREFATINSSDRPWQMPFAAAIAAGLPLLVAAAFGRMAEGMIVSLSGFVFLYLPATPLHHRMGALMAFCFGMICCFTLGAFAHVMPIARAPLTTLVAIFATMICRYYRVGPPGSLFFIMACAIGAYTPGAWSDIPFRTGLLAIGCIHTLLIAYIYSIFILARRPADAIPPAPVAGFNRVWFDSIVIGLFIGLSLSLAEALSLEKPYWVPISCLAIIQGVSLRAVWNRQVHRIAGTAIGLLLTWGMLPFVENGWIVATMVMGLIFLIETAIVRHYGFAVIFITPVAILLAEAPTLGHGDTDALVAARFIDTLLGVSVGFVGALCLHNPVFRTRAGRWLRPLIPERMIEGD
ncbi:FUSC family protein [Sinisalibacter aestuarii]|nr:FUSC family protein [Sinisalibacter aestuarii]